MDAHDEDVRIRVFIIIIQHPAMRATTLLRDTLGIQTVTVRNVSYDDSGPVLEIVPKKRSPRCGECLQPARRVKDKRSRRWRHLDLMGQTVHLLYSIRRVHCDACGSVKTEHVDWAGHSSAFTHAFEERTAFLAQQSSKTAVSKLLRIAWTTVGKIISRVVTAKLDADGDRLDGLEHIGIDELSYRRHHEYITIVIDHTNPRAVWSSEGKNAATLSKFFEELGPERCAKIKTVTIDMSPAYISAVRKCVPNATLIFDRFHVQRLVQNAMDETRRDAVREASTKDEKAELKNTRWPLLKSPWNLSNEETQTLEDMEHSNRDLFRGYLLKESFAGILDRRQINVAGEMLDDWIREAVQSGLPHFAKAARTVNRCRDGILEYVRTGFSNGRTEGLNSKARTITRRAYGFHSARALISMLFLCCGGIHVTPAFSQPPAFH